MKELDRERQVDACDSEGGWTFMETLIVIAIVLVLTSSVGFMAIGYLDKARVVTARTQMDSFSVALESYYIDCGCYPQPDQGLSALWSQSGYESAIDKWNGPYMLRNIPSDPWGHPYIYKIPGENGLPYTIISCGADGKEGGEGNDADIVSYRN